MTDEGYIISKVRDLKDEVAELENQLESIRIVLNREKVERDAFVSKIESFKKDFQSSKNDFEQSRIANVALNEKLGEILNGNISRIDNEITKKAEVIRDTISKSIASVDSPLYRELDKKLTAELLIQLAKWEKDIQVDLAEFKHELFVMIKHPEKIPKNIELMKSTIRTGKK